MKKILTFFAALACVMSMSAATWTVAGAPASIFGTEWDPSNTANVMADKGDGTYKWEKSDLTLAASTIQFKVVKGNAWGEEYPSANYELKIKESGVYTITITFNEGTHEVNAVATKQGAAEVIPTIELAGDMTNWGDGKLELTMAADELTASLTIPLEAQDYFFKMIIAGGWTSDGATITRENNTTVFTGANSDNNCTLTADVAGDYTFTWVYKTNTLTVTYPEAGENPGEEPGDDPVVTPDPETGVTYNVTVPAGTKACYIAGEMNEWKQQEMNKVDETHYTLTIETATTAMKYKYCSGPSWDYVEMAADGVTNIVDRTYAANDVVESWKAVYDPAGENPGEEPGDDPVVTPDPETGVTYNVTVPAGTKACYIAGEMNAWKQQEMNKVDDTHYTLTIETATTAMMYKYCSGPSWDYVEMHADGATNVENRTYAANDVVEAWKAVYDPAGETPGEEPGDDPVVTPDPETGVTYTVTVPAGTKACYIAGEMNSWSFTEMTKTDDTHYTVTLAEATETMGYKYCSGPGWAYVELTEEGGEVANRTYAANDVVEAWKSVYDPATAPTPGEAKDITIKAKVPATWTETITAWVWPTGEPGKEVIPTKEGDWYVYTEHCSELNIIFKNGEGWNGDVNKTADITVTESTCIAITAGTNKATHTIVDCEEEPGDDPIVTPDPETGVTYNVTVPVGTKACYIAGEMNTWSFTEMTKVDETHYTITIAEATTAMGYKYCSGPGWDYVEMQADGATDVQNRTYAANDVVEAWKAVYDPAGENPGDDPIVTPTDAAYVLMGVGGDWETGIAFTRNEANTLEEEYMLLGQVISEGDAVKVVGIVDGVATYYYNTVDEASVSHTLSEEYQNIVLAPGTYDFYFKVASQVIYIGASLPSAVDNVTVEGKAVKVIRNGQMYILRDGVMYNAIGQIAE